MSQITQNYGQDFINGLLSAQKFKQFKSDLQTSQIQRSLLEQTLQHNATMQPLLQAHEQAVNENLNTQNESMLLANQLAQMEQPSKVEEAAGRATEATARGRSATVQADTAEATKGQAIGEGNLAIQKHLAELLAPGGASITDADILAQLKNSGAVGKTPADWTAMVSVMRPMLDQQRQTYQANQGVLQAHANEANAQAELHGYAAIGKASMVGKDISDLAAVNPDQYMASRDQLQEHLTNTIGEKGAQYVMDLADFRAKTAKRDAADRASGKGVGGDTTITTSPGDMEFQKKLGDELGTLRATLNTTKRDLVDEQGKTTTLGFGGPSADVIKAKKAKIDLLTQQIEDTKNELHPVKKEVNKQGIQNDTSFMTKAIAPKLDALESQRVNVANAKDEDLPKIVDFLTKKGISVDLPTLKALRDRQKSRSN